MSEENLSFLENLLGKKIFNNIYKINKIFERSSKCKCYKILVPEDLDKNHKCGVLLFYNFFIN